MRNTYLLSLSFCTATALISIILPIILILLSNTSFPEISLSSPVSSSFKLPTSIPQVSTEMHHFSKLLKDKLAEASSGNSATKSHQTPSASGATGSTLPKIILFGDSLTEWAFNTPEGFGSVLTRRWEGRAVVRNCGKAAQTSETLKTLFSQTIHSVSSQPQPPPLLYIIFLGANDAVLPPGGQHVPLPTFESNLRHYVSIILTTPAYSTTKIVLVTPPPINVRACSAHAKREDERKGQGFRTWDSKRTYARKVMDVARDFEARGLGDRVAGYDLWERLVGWECEKMGARDEERLPGCGLPGAREFENGIFTDRLHFGEKGYKIVTDGLLELLAGKWPEVFG
ncbi:SGNH hydrolase [Aulographum hederae CBS 113979]|uniref:SGNH hydrolase n=1 Tax=Aulographum hederae CBS 113979 TaxID=1176131 RepID=A0A6G1GN06_9PEZI|nr:SGNH hydrolase [Aulographum hederae CBS 113979]